MIWKLYLLQAKDEGFYTMGRRFPSIRLKSKDKKDAKKILAFSASDKAVEVNGAKGSCVRAASAIYGDEPSKLDDFESNIYENGHIVMKNDDRGWCIIIPTNISRYGDFMLALTASD